MTTITEILTEAFNRVKAEHGVNLSRVEYDTVADHVIGVKFKASCTQPKKDAKAIGKEIHERWYGQIPIAPVGRPLEATHYGSLAGYTDSYWRLTDTELHVLEDDTWKCFDDRNPERWAASLTPLT